MPSGFHAEEIKETINDLTIFNDDSDTQSTDEESTTNSTIFNDDCGNQSTDEEYSDLPIGNEITRRIERIIRRLEDAHFNFTSLLSREEDPFGIIRLFTQ